MPCIRVTLLNMTLLNIGVKRMYVYMYIHINMTLFNIGVKRNGKGQSGGQYRVAKMRDMQHVAGLFSQKSHQL